MRRKMEEDKIKNRRIMAKETKWKETNNYYEKEELKPMHTLEITPYIKNLIYCLPTKP